MGRKLTTSQFIEKAILVHGEKEFDYSITEYNGRHSKLNIIHVRCGNTINVQAGFHLRGGLCRYCNGSSQLTQSEFESKVRDKYGDVYDLSKAIYVNSKTKLELTCKEHQIAFKMNLGNLMRGNQGCYKCRKEITNTEELKSAIISKHGKGRYDLSKVVFKKRSQKVDIGCNFCGCWYKQRIGNILYGYGCNNCSWLEKSKKSANKYGKLFIEKSILLYGNRYDYSKVNYVTAKTKVKVFCNKHKKYFFINPDNHLNGGGCKWCNIPRGENLVIRFLEKRNILFKHETSIKGCRDISKLRFDFYLPSHKIAIEVQGKQHYEVIEFFGGLKEFKERKRRDQIKRVFCRQEGIHLIEIPYWDLDKIEKILLRELKINHSQNTHQREFLGQQLRLF